ncbi:cation diffusion facilitator family transporter [Schinkia azotoformans]|uniref:cation diffusion facilitator family transporter n=1 Tax=Schinkia azotoformans TaxID=1454 RepID=UPI002DB8F495|nr:cation diffusion facilitator family transporter [Schinkia azotoformans]MEC1722701.1 cation diffusion facilitator family transporter [Schinkia azotoformans]MED4413051.1 cation diffusion facilitator family transporter [Schinkia azotoformans]
MVSSNRKMQVASLSIISNTALIIFKVIAGVLSGSVSIISEAIHSGMDLIASIIAFVSVKVSAKPADEKHPYGHGKIENMSALIEGLLIFVAAIMIITEAVKKLIEPAELEQTNIAMAVMFISAFINWMVSRKLYKVAKEEDSMALEADALHLKTDVYTSLGVGIGILLIAITGLSILDSIVAILVALLIIKEAWDLCKSAFDFLLDSKLSDEEVEKVKKIILNHSHQFIDYHKLKTRRSGNMKHIDFHITVPSELTAKEIHDIIGSLKKEMKETLKNTRVNVHVDPSEQHN